MNHVHTEKPQFIYGHLEVICREFAAAWHDNGFSEIWGFSVKVNGAELMRAAYSIHGHLAHSSINDGPSAFKKMALIGSLLNRNSNIFNYYNRDARLSDGQANQISVAGTGGVAGLKVEMHPRFMCIILPKLSYLFEFRFHDGAKPVDKWGYCSDHHKLDLTWWLRSKLALVRN